MCTIIIFETTKVKHTFKKCIKSICINKLYFNYNYICIYFILYMFNYIFTLNNILN